MLESISNFLYQLQQFAQQQVTLQLNNVNGMSIGVIFIAGLLTSLTPCMLSMLPITVAYIGGYQVQGKFKALIQSVWFSFGLATTLAALGIFAAFLGKVYGQIGIGLPIIVSLVAILMGLNLLEIIPLRFPTLQSTDWIKEDFPPAIRSYLLGLTFGLIASPCSTPVLATLLTWVASSQNLFLGGILLLSYTLGYVCPLILVGTFTGTLKQILELRRYAGWINPLSGAILIGFGILSLLWRLPTNLI